MNCGGELVHKGSHPLWLLRRGVEGVLNVDEPAVKPMVHHQCDCDVLRQRRDSVLAQLGLPRADARCKCRTQALDGSKGARHWVACVQECTRIQLALVPLGDECAQNLRSRARAHACGQEDQEDGRETRDAVGRRRTGTPWRCAASVHIGGGTVKRQCAKYTKRSMYCHALSVYGSTPPGLHRVDLVRKPQ